MRNKIFLAPALLIAISLPSFAATADAPLRLPFPAPGSEPTPLAVCAAEPATAAPQALPANPATAGDKSLVCSTDCGHQMCRGELPGTVCGAYPKIGACNMMAEICSSDGRYRCYCKY